MMMSESRLFVLLDDYDHRVMALLDQLTRQQQRVEELEKEVANQKETIQNLQNQAREKQKKATGGAATFTKSKDFSKLVSSNLPDPVAREEVKQKLDEYIRDLDRCIAHLSTLS